jgi:hypothetical protein
MVPLLLLVWLLRLTSIAGGQEHASNCWCSCMGHGKTQLLHFCCFVKVTKAEIPQLNDLYPSPRTATQTRPQHLLLLRLTSIAGGQAAACTLNISS